MIFPDITTYPDIQRRAITKARREGYATFSVENITYIVKRNIAGFHIDASFDNNQVGYIFTDFRANHYALKVESKFRSKGVGKVLFTTKQALDGILPEEWSRVYSRMFFLIHFGYMPLLHISQVSCSSEDRPFTQKEARILLDDLVFYVKNQNNLPDWFKACPFLIRMIYAPQSAKSLLQMILSKA